jgi:CRP-like cAMP-binding protein
MDEEVEHSANPLARKLAHFVPLAEEDFRVLDRLMEPDERFEADQDIVAEGQVPRSVFVLKEGMACRYRALSDGRRQIMTFLLPGDLCDLHVFLFKAMDHSIGTLTPVRIAAIAQADVLDMTVRHPRISVGLWWSTMQEAVMLRERIVSLGRRDAHARVAYLLCELVWRQQAIGQGRNDTITLPLTQSELADALGLTAVHINRVLQDLRQQNLLILEQRRLVLLDIDALARIAAFNADYLHLGGAPEGIRRYFDQLDRKRPEDGSAASGHALG